MSFSLGLVLPEPGLAGAKCGLLAVGYLQLVEDIGDVVGNRLGAQGQQPGDFGVRGTLRHEVQHLTLAVGQSGERFSGNSRTVGGEEASEACGDAATLSRPKSTSHICRKNRKLPDLDSNQMTNP